MELCKNYICSYFCRTYHDTLFIAREEPLAAACEPLAEPLAAAWQSRRPSPSVLAAACRPSYSRLPPPAELPAEPLAEPLAEPS